MASTHSVPTVSLRKQSSFLPEPIENEFAYLELASPPQKYLIDFRHPSYPDNSNLLLSLKAWDNSGGGLHYGFAFTACAIIANNRFDGYLSEAKDGSTKVRLCWESCLLPRRHGYYFHVPGPDGSPTPYRWPFVPSFREWQFPSELPSMWEKCAEEQIDSTNAAQSNLSGAVQQRDIACKISSHLTGTEVAHLIPAHESIWFKTNGMAKYNSNTSLDGSSLVRDPNNALLLRADLHRAFDDRVFCLFPKDDIGFAVHVLQSAPDIRVLYHNRRVDAPQCDAHFIFARFAWSIFPCLSNFISSSEKPRLVVTRDESSEEWIEGSMSAAVLKSKSVASRSNSPTKRSRLSSALEEEDAEPKEFGDVRRGKRHKGGHLSLNLSRRDEGPCVGNDDGLTDGESGISSTESKATDSFCSSVDKMRREVIALQRPPGYCLEPYDRSRPAREELEIMGVEIRDLDADI